MIEFEGISVSITNYEEGLETSNVNDDIADITAEKRHINLDDFMVEFSIKKDKFISTYGTRPQYIKLPAWIYEEIAHHPICYVRNPKKGDVFFQCLRCCPTPSISKLEEIDVF